MDAELIPGQLDLVEELKKIARPVEWSEWDELIALAKQELFDRLAESA